MAGDDELAPPAMSRSGFRRPGPAGAVTRNDLLTSAVVLALQVGLSLAVTQQHPGSTHVNGLEWLLVVAGPLALLARRSHPVVVLWVTFAATLGPSATGFSYLSLLVAFFLAAVGGHRRAAWTVIVVGFVSSLWEIPLIWGQPESSLNDALILGGWLAVLVVAAEAVRMRRERVAERRAAQQVEERRRASDERLRMARDLHDVIGHNISLINVQAAVGLDLMDTQPEQARAALAAIKTVSKDAMGELRTMLATLRQDDDEAPRSPTPGLARLGELIDLTRAAGLPIALESDSAPPRIPAAVDVTAYRIVQEALTNVTRHAPGAKVTVRIGHEQDAVVVEIVDTGCPRANPGIPHEVGHGTGIAGMRERVMALGGRLEAGPRAGGGFRVAAQLPVEVDVIRVVLADDQALLRAGFRALLDAREDIEVVGEAADGAEAVALAKTLRPDVVLIDIRMPGLDGLDATRRITADPNLGQVRIVILTTFELDEYLFEALRHGASGFLVKDTEPADLVTAVRVVAAGDSLISPGMTRRLVAEFAAPAKQPRSNRELDVLTDREREVMAQAAGGLTNDEIAQQLYLSPATVRTHVSRAMIKLGARDRTQLVVLAYETGLVRPGWVPD